MLLKYSKFLILNAISPPSERHSLLGKNTGRIIERAQNEVNMKAESVSKWMTAFVTRYGVKAQLL